MKWNYQIIKDGKRFYLAEVIRTDEGKLRNLWAIIDDTDGGDEYEVKLDIANRFHDILKYPVLEVKNNKLYERKV